MKVTIDFDEEIESVIQHHLDTGVTVQRYIRAAVVYFNKMLAKEKEGKVSCGYGDKSRFSQYNTVDNPSNAFEEV